MKIFKSKKNDLYLSDRPPLTPLGKLGLGITYAILITWACIVLWPIAQIIISSFNGKQGKYLILNDGFEFSLKHFDYLFNNTLYLKWMGNTLFIGIATAILTVVVISFTGYAYSRYRFNFISCKYRRESYI